jgi:thiamine biosynthesis lipoprotein
MDADPASGDAARPGAIMASPRHLVSLRESRIAMDTAITVEVVYDQDAPPPREQAEAALGWFAEVEERCSRFHAASELSRLCATTGTAVEVSPLLFTAEATGGAFDPTIGASMARAGFARNYRTGETVAAPNADRMATWRDVELEETARTILLRRPLLLDLGAVAKGMAIDLAAESLRRFPGYAVDAGGDLYLGGENVDGPWLVGVAHPRQPGDLATRLRVRDRAVCTSGDYERRAPGSGVGHIMDARGSEPAPGIVSVTVVAPSAMVADALGTAAFALGPEEGLRFLEEQAGVDGLIVTTSLQAQATSGWADYVA